jgi:hypothetical protein
MLGTNSFDSAASWPMEVGAPIVAGALSVALLLAWIMIGVSVAAADTIADASGVSVNRVERGPFAVRSFISGSPNRHSARTKGRFEGCEPVVSFLADRHLSHIAARCVS